MRLITRLLAPLILFFTMFLPSGVASADPAEVIGGGTSSFGFNYCNGEGVIEGEATFIIVSKEQKDGTFLQFQTVYGTAVGSQGNQYVFHYTTQGKFSFPDPSYSFSEHHVLVSKGSEPNVDIVVLHTQDGLIRFDIVCRG